jgi:hypothetical protein
MSSPYISTSSLQISGYAGMIYLLVLFFEWFRNHIKKQDDNVPSIKKGNTAGLILGSLLIGIVVTFLILDISNGFFNEIQGTPIYIFFMMSTIVFVMVSFYILWEVFKKAAARFCISKSNTGKKDDQGVNKPAPKYSID